MRQHNPPHPGEFIREVYLAPCKGAISRSEIAKRIGVSRSAFNRLVNEDADLSSEMALRISCALGGTPESWLGMQSAYNLWNASKKIDVSAIERIDNTVFG